MRTSQFLFGTEPISSFETVHIPSVDNSSCELAMMDVRDYLACCISTPWAGIVPNRYVLIPGEGQEKTTSYFLVEELMLDGRSLEIM